MLVKNLNFNMRPASENSAMQMIVLATAGPSESIVQQTAAQIPWLHSCQLLDRKYQGALFRFRLLEMMKPVQNAIAGSLSPYYHQANEILRIRLLSRTTDIAEPAYDRTGSGRIPRKTNSLSITIAGNSRDSPPRRLNSKRRII